MYLFLKSIHGLCALLSISGFLLRCFWMRQQSPNLQRKWVKILPHIIDTVFLFSGVALVFSLGLGIGQQAWLLTKIGLLVLYIALGLVALKFGKGAGQRYVAAILAVLVFLYIIGVAIGKSPLGWFA